LVFGVEDTVGDFLSDDSVGSGERVLETRVEGLESLGADSLFFTASFGVFELKVGETVFLCLLNVLLGQITGNLEVRVDDLHGSLVLQGVLSASTLLEVSLLDSTELGLNLVRVDNSGEISAGHHGSIKLVAALLNTFLSVGTKDVVKVLESISSEDNESTEMTTGGELEEVKSVNVADINTGKVAGGSLEVGVLVTVNDKGSLGHLEAGVSLFVGTSTGGLGGTDASHIIGSTDLLEGGKESLGGVNVKGVNDKGEFGNVHDVVTSGNNKRSNSGGSEG